MPLRFPDLPEIPAAQRAEGRMSLRYEDVAQDGRLMLHALPHGIGEVMWAKALSQAGIARMLAAQGIVPILSRFVIEGGGGPIAVRKPLHGEGGWWLAHTVEGNAAGGAVDRLLLNIALDVSGEKDRTYGPPPEGAGTRIPLGRVLAEHVFSRPFAPKGERKVLRFDAEGLPAIPALRQDWRPGADLLHLPADARALEDTLRVDPAPIVFGLGHTDSNQHINSLVYPWLFEQAALRRIADLGRDARVLCRFVEIAYRKPCFAGERVRIELRVYEAADGALGAVGVFLPHGAAAGAAPHAWVRMELGR